jgi:hypothetical protein
MDAIADWFKQYQVESIELWISGLIEAGGITKLVVSAKGEGGKSYVKAGANYTIDLISFFLLLCLFRPIS